MVGSIYAKCLIRLRIKQVFHIDSEKDYLYKDKVLLEWIHKKFKDIIVNSACERYILEDVPSKNNARHIWVYWDNLSKMPLVVKQCINSIIL